MSVSMPSGIICRPADTQNTDFFPRCHLQVHIDGQLDADGEEAAETETREADAEKASTSQTGSSDARQRTRRQKRRMADMVLMLEQVSGGMERRASERFALSLRSPFRRLESPVNPFWDPSPTPVGACVLSCRRSKSRLCGRRESSSIFDIEGATRDEREEDDKAISAPNSGCCRESGSICREQLIHCQSLRCPTSESEERQREREKVSRTKGLSV